MAKAPRWSGKAVIKIFTKIGYRVVRQRGSHFRLHHKYKKPLTIPDHSIIGPGLLRKILRDAEIRMDEFLRYMKSK